MRRNWNYLAAVLVAATLLAGGALAQSKGKPETLTGTITDTMCGAKHTMKNSTDKECTLGCVKMGAKYGLVVGDKVYELEGKPSELEKLAGAKAKITGTVDGNKVHVTAVSPAG